MKEKPTNEDVKIIIQYNNKKDAEYFQNIMQKLFDSYIIKAMQNEKNK